LYRVSNMAEVEEWVSLTEAASQLGVSVQTLRRRIKDDQLQARKVVSPYGPAWEVCLSKLNRVPNTPAQELDREVNTEAVDQGGSSTVDSELSGIDEGESPTAEQAPSPTPGMVEALELIRQLQAEVVQKAETAALWQGRAEVLGMQLVQAQETIKALEAPKTDDEGEPLPWWRSWWQRLTIGAE
jgi:hypothetical protein